VFCGYFLNCKDRRLEYRQPPIPIYDFLCSFRKATRLLRFIFLPLPTARESPLVRQSHSRCWRSSTSLTLSWPIRGLAWRCRGSLVIKRPLPSSASLSRSTRRKLTPVNQNILAPQRRHNGGESGNAGLVHGAWTHWRRLSCLIIGKPGLSKRQTDSSLFPP
jgi:hypothetical protein